MVSKMISFCFPFRMDVYTISAGVLDGDGKRRSAKTYRRWLQPPSLQWQATRSLLRDHPDITDWSREDLKCLGLSDAVLDYAGNADLAA